MARLVEASGGTVQLRASVERLEQEPDGRWRVTALAADAKTEYRADSVVLALPFEQTRRLLPGLPVIDAESPLAAKIEMFAHSPFTSILLWYDRQITDLHHAWLLDTTIEWFFHKSKIRGYAPEQGSYVEVVIAGSKAQLGMTREEILQPALEELARFFPETKRAKLLKSGILKEARATFSVTPGLDRYRPAQRTAWPGLYVAGDWTATEWPSTMEGAVRSGRLAAGAVVGEPARFMAAELAASGLMPLFIR
jgi:zeta-carotene desaturase